MDKLNPLSFFAGLLLFCVLASCSNYSSVTPTPQPIDSTTKLSATPLLNSCPAKKTVSNLTENSKMLPPNATPISAGYWRQREHTSLSPDGKWEVDFNILNSIIVQTSFKKERLHTSGNISLGPYFRLESWFPDSKGFIIFDADQGGQKSSYDRLIIFRIDETNHTLNYSVFEPLKERNQAFWQEVTISPDGDKIAVIVDFRTIYIINQKAEPIHIIQPLDKKGHLDQITWTNYGLIYVARGIRNDPQHTEMRLINPDKPSDGSILLRDDVSLQIIESIDPFSPQIMFFHYSSNTDTSASGELAIFNLETKQIEKLLIIVHGYDLSGIESVNANDQHLVALKHCDEGENFYIFDWVTGRLTNKLKHVNGILEWRQDLQAFIVSQGEYPNNWLESISP